MPWKEVEETLRCFLLLLMALPNKILGGKPPQNLGMLNVARNDTAPSPRGGMQPEVIVPGWWNIAGDFKGTSGCHVFICTIDFMHWDV